MVHDYTRSLNIIVIKESEVIEYMGFNGESRFLYNRLRCQFFLTSGLFTGCAIINVIRANVTFTSPSKNTRNTIGRHHLILVLINCNAQDELILPSSNH